MNRPRGKIVTMGAGTATVSVDAAVACARCAAGRGCGAGLLEPRRRRLLQVRIDPGLEVAEGDTVRLELGPQRLLRAAWLAYGLPLFSMVILVAAAARLAPGNEAAALAAAVAGLIAGFGAGRRGLHKGACLQELLPVASRGADPGSTVT